ncbi:MAG TPA: dipeptide epimerase [Patescibacteria group bacterium]|nr:dipeptide epimerase [Patescibacteria group bacterium]
MKKSTLIRKTRAYVVKAPLIYPFRTALGQHDYLENVYVELKLNDGTRGFGEAAIAPHITGESVAKTLKNIEEAGDALIGQDASEYLRLSCDLNERLSDNKSAIAALEMGMLDAVCKQKKIPLWKFFGRSARRVVTDITIVISSLEETQRAARQFVRQGFRAFKVKIGRDQELDYQRILAVQRIAPHARIYIDANQGYTAQETLRLLRSLKGVGVVPALIEQPVPKADFEGLQEVSRQAGILVCADESASSLADVKKIIRHRAAGAINIKLMKFGIFRAQEVYSLARNNGVKLMMGAMMETSLGIAAAAHFASGLGGIDYIDLDCPFFIKKGWERNPYVSANGVYDLKKCRSGIGINPKRA